MPPAALVPGHVAELERPVRHPDRALGEREARRDLLDLGVLVDEHAQLLGMHCERHASSFGKRAANLTGARLVVDLEDVVLGQYREKAIRAARSPASAAWRASMYIRRSVAASR